MATLDIYPDAGNPGTTSVDGITYSYSNNEDFSTKRGHATGTVSATSKAENFATLYASSSSASGNCTNIERAVFTFDPSTTLSGATISGVSLFICGYSSIPNYWNGDANNNIIVCAVTPAATNQVSTSDYLFSTYGTTAFCTFSIASIAASNYNEFSLNAAGIANVDSQKSTIITLGVLTGWDFNATGPSTWGSGEREGGLTGYCSDNDSNKPYLTVTYSSSSIKTVDGLAKASVQTVNGLAIASVKIINGLA